jgi:L-seryl-tRNA(Ser) seleniumtransferase
MSTPNDLLRALPAVDALLNSDTGAALVRQYGREPVLVAIRDALEATRAKLRGGEILPYDSASLLMQSAELLEQGFAPSLRPVINATGVIIHTNLGRAPLSDAAQQAMVDVAASYSTLEFDLDSGQRGSRSVHVANLLKEVTGAEAALVVNNNAAGLVLSLSALAREREVIISRGQLVEIGGGFRVPDVMTQSSATLVEVGTTNRTRAADYERAITPKTALLMRAHASNFKQIGFVEAASLSEMAEIAHSHGLYLVDDLGSGTLLDTAHFGLDHEPMAQESLQAGADLAAFSGDKLLGGPQAGILVGKKTLIDMLRQHPLARAIRADKLCLAALTATLDHYRKGEALEKIPVWRMISRSLADIEAAAQAWAQRVGGMVIPGESAVGGGSLPGATLPTALLALDVSRPDSFAAKLRASNPPVVARISEGRVLFDPRTVLPRQEEALLRVLADALTGGKNPGNGA